MNSSLLNDFGVSAFVLSKFKTLAKTMENNTIDIRTTIVDFETLIFRKQKLVKYTRI